TATRDGGAWFGTAAGVSWFDGRIWRSLPAGSGANPPLEFVNALYEDSRGNLWIGTNHRGVFRYDRQAIANRLKAADCASVRADTSAAVGDTLGTSWTVYGAAQGLASDAALFGFEDGAGDLWVGTDGGLSRWQGGAWSTIPGGDGSAFQSFPAMLEDERGTL